MYLRWCGDVAVSSFADARFCIVLRARTSTLILICSFGSGAPTTLDPLRADRSLPGSTMRFLCSVVIDLLLSICRKRRNTGNSRVPKRPAFPQFGFAAGYIVIRTASLLQVDLWLFAHRMKNGPPGAHPCRVRTPAPDLQGLWEFPRDRHGQTAYWTITRWRSPNEIFGFGLTARG